MYIIFFVIIKKTIQLRKNNITIDVKKGVHNVDTYICKS